MSSSRGLSAWLLLLAVAACGDRDAPDREAARSVSGELYEQHIARLASDEFEGRKPGTAGETKTLAYLTDAYRRLGLEALAGSSYLQSVPLVAITTSPEARLAFSGAAGLPQLEYPRNVVLWTKRVVPRIDVKGSPLVFVGYGVVAPEDGWNDYEGIDMRGKTAVILINDPGFAAGDETIFRGRALTYYGRWTYKFEEAARQGAVGALIVHETEPAAYGWDTVVNSWTGPQLDKVTADDNMGRVQFEGWLDLQAGEQLFKAAGQDFTALKASANRKDFKPVPLGQLSASVSLRNTIRRSSSSNVIGVLRGRERPDEYVVYLAHWDHLGRAEGRDGDAIFNGAVDNATGVAGLLAIADAFGRASRKPERSIAFLAVTAEESGLLGSAYYVDNPLFPHAQTVAAINMDAMYFGGPTRDVRVVGHGASELDGYLTEAARAQDRRIEPEPTPEKGFFYRSDHFNFARNGVPSLYIKLGIDDRERGEEWGRREQEVYTAERYHKPSDEYRPGMDLRGSLQDVELLHAVGERLASEKTFPAWNAGSEFRAARERSRANAR